MGWRVERSRGHCCFCWGAEFRHKLGLLLALTLTFCCPAVRADEGALAEQLFREGQALMNEENFAKACPKLAESQRLDPSTGTLLNLAVCHQKMGMLASAWNEYNHVIAWARKDQRQDRETYAQARLAEVEPLLSHLTIDVPEEVRTEGFTLKFDGTEVRPAAWGVALPVDPGEHEVTAAAPGKTEWSTRVAVTGEAQQMSVTVPALEDLPPEPTKDEGAQPSESLSEDRGRTQRIVGLSLGGVGLVGIGLGAAFGLDAMSKKKKAEEGGCVDAMCPQPAGDTRDQARTSGLISTIAFAVGGAFAATGVVLYFIAPKRTVDAQPEVAWRAGVAPLAGGADLRFEAAW